MPSPNNENADLETVKILEMLQEGKITVDEAQRLIQHLSRPATPITEVVLAEQKKLSFLRVVVRGSGNERVDIRVPLKLIRLGLSFSDHLPEKAKNAIVENGVDLSQLESLDEDEFLDAIGDLRIDVEDGEDKVQIFCE